MRSKGFFGMGDLRIMAIILAANLNGTRKKRNLPIKADQTFDCPTGESGVSPEQRVLQTSTEPIKLESSPTFAATGQAAGW
jgi:hypothetical protein